MSSLIGFVLDLCSFRVLSVVGPNRFLVCLHNSVIFFFSFFWGERKDSLLSAENVNYFSETTKDHKHETVCKLIMIMTVYVHIRVHFLPGKVLVMQVLAL